MSALLRYCFAVCVLLPFGLSCEQPPASNSTADSGTMSPLTAGVRGGKATYRVTSPPKTFNYLLANDEPSIVLSFFLLNSRLVEFDHSTQKYVPGLAESWTTAADRQTVDVKLREGLKFSDGHELTADDVAFTLEVTYDERTGSPAFRDAILVNGKAINVKVVDPRSLQFAFPEPVASPDNYLYNIAVLPRHALEADHRNGTFAEAWKITSNPESVVTSGPFVVASSTAGEHVVLKRNPHYWKFDEKGNRLPYLDELSVEVVPDSNQAMVGLNQSSLDIVDRIRPADYASLMDATGSVKAYDLGPGLGVDYIWFNLNRAKPDGTALNNATKFAWFSDARFRKAVSMAVDRSGICATTLQGLATPLYGFVSPANHTWADPQLPKIEHDLTRAATLLAEAGFATRGTPDAPQLFDAHGNRVEFSLLVPAENEPRKLMAAVVQNDLAKLGIRMQVVPVEFSAVTTAWTKTYEYDAILLGLSVTDLEPSTYGNLLLSSGDAHQWQPNQKTPATEWEANIDKLFFEQAREGDPQKRADVFRQIQQSMAEASPIIPIAARHILSAANTSLGNYSPSPVFPYSMWNADRLFIKEQR